MVELLEACKKGTPPPMGRWGSLPMNGQVSCEGPMGKLACTVIVYSLVSITLCMRHIFTTHVIGKTSLFDKPPGPGQFMRTDEIKGSVCYVVMSGMIGCTTDERAGT